MISGLPKVQQIRRGDTRRKRNLLGRKENKEAPKGGGMSVAAGPRLSGTAKTLRTSARGKSLNLSSYSKIPDAQ